MKKNHDMYHSWMRNSLSGLTCLHLLEIREQSMSYPTCPKWSHFHLSVWDVKMSSLNIWPSATFRDFSPIWQTGYVQICACVHICTHTHKHSCTHTYYRAVLFHSQTLSCIFQPMAIPRNSLKKVAIQKSYKNVFSLWTEVGFPVSPEDGRALLRTGETALHKEPGMYRFTAKYSPINTTF